MGVLRSTFTGTHGGTQGYFHGYSRGFSRGGTQEYSRAGVNELERNTPQAFSHFTYEVRPGRSAPPCEYPVSTREYPILSGTPDNRRRWRAIG